MCSAPEDIRRLVGGGGGVRGRAVFSVIVFGVLSSALVSGYPAAVDGVPMLEAEHDERMVPADENRGKTLVTILPRRIRQLENERLPSTSLARLTGLLYNQLLKESAVGLGRELPKRQPPGKICVWKICPDFPY